MTWIVEVILQHRGMKDESSEYVSFESRDQAEEAVDKLRKDCADAGSEDFITVSSPAKRIDFVKQDFRRVRLYEQPKAQPYRVV